jgi:hypothetical protein
MQKLPHFLFNRTLGVPRAGLDEVAKKIVSPPRKLYLAALLFKTTKGSIF